MSGRRVEWRVSGGVGSEWEEMGWGVSGGVESEWEEVGSEWEGVGWGVGGRRVCGGLGGRRE